VGISKPAAHNASLTLTLPPTADRIVLYLVVAAICVCSQGQDWKLLFAGAADVAVDAAAAAGGPAMPRSAACAAVNRRRLHLLW